MYVLHVYLPWIRKHEKSQIIIIIKGEREKREDTSKVDMMFKLVHIHSSYPTCSSIALVINYVSPMLLHQFDVI